MAQKTNKKEVSKNIFSELYQINVDERSKKTGEFDYISWSYAWAEIMERYPYSYSTVYESEDGINYFTDGRTAWVKVGFTLVNNKKEEKEYIEYYPVYDSRHNALPIAKVTSHHVNTAIQRGTTKAIARHGLGLYLYHGEDLVEIEQEEIQEKQETQDKQKAQDKQDTPMDQLILEHAALRQKMNELGIDVHNEKTEKYILKTARVNRHDTQLTQPELERVNMCYKQMIRNNQKP